MPTDIQHSNRWRPEVVAFADAMEAQLRANDHKPGWKNDHPLRLISRVHDEYEELRDILRDSRAGTVMENLDVRKWGPCNDESARSRILKEAADVANMAMMTADVCGALPHA